jgi:hypothetical protein
MTGRAGRSGCARAPAVVRCVHAAAPTVADARVGENARVPAYTLSEEAVRHAKRLIDARRYVLRSRLAGRAAPRAGAERVPERSTPGRSTPPGISALPTRGRGDEGALRVCLRRLPPSAPDGADRLQLPCRGVAAQGDRARSTRAPAVPRPKERRPMTRRPRAAAPLGEGSGFAAKPARRAQRRPTSTVDAGGRCVDVRRFERRPPRQRN